MAKMIPSTMFDTGSEGEVRVFDSLRNLLPNDYIVMHSLRWIGSSGKRSQGEADFVIFHPKKGVLALEVKAGILEYKHRVWKQTNRKTGISKIIDDPEDQASKSKFKFINILNKPNCMVCHGVWFPSVHFNKGILPPNYHEDMLLDQKSLESPVDAINKVFEFWSKQMGRTTSLNKIQADNIINILAPSLSLIPSLKLEYENTEKEFLQLTNEQTRVLGFLQFQKKACISGAAGTGKTLIGIEKARQLHVQDKKVLYLCFNKLLAEYLNIRYSHYGFEISTFDSLAANYGLMKPSFEETRTYFLEYLLDDNADFPFTDIVIDEGQDFSNDWLEMLDFKINGDFYIFYDKNQSLYAKPLPKFIEDADTKLTLTINCRNTEAIAKSSYGAIDYKNASKDFLSGIEGKKPELIPILSTSRAQAKQITKIINLFRSETNVPLNNIAVITMESWENSSLKEISEFLKFEWSNTIENNKVNLNTIRKFKGLEADLLIITDLDWNKMVNQTYRNLLYTASSRAKHQLYIISPEMNDINIDLVLKSILGEESKRTGIKKFKKQFNL